MSRLAAIAVIGMLLGGCQSTTTSSSDGALRGTASVVAGPWHAQLASPGGPLPFTLEIREYAGALTATARNGSEAVVFSSVEVDDRDIVLRIDAYDSEIRAHLSEANNRLDGHWTKTTPSGPSTMEFSAFSGSRPRFSAPIVPPKHDTPALIDGDWSLKFEEPDGSSFVGHAIFESSDGRLLGTIMTDTGDYRYLEGRYDKGTLELSCFDGGHAFLFRARVDAEGVLHGDFWSRNAYHATWTGRRLDGGPSPLADPFASVELSSTETEGRFRFAFPDRYGTMVSDSDDRFVGKVVLIDIFGTWCPNCNDYAPRLARWHRDYGPRGLELVGLAFEFSGDTQRDRAQLGIYARTHHIEFPLLLAGTSDKGDAAVALPSLDVVKSYPTTVLVGRDGTVRHIHSGFAGPATGHHHTALIERFEQQIEALLAEPSPALVQTR